MRKFKRASFLLTIVIIAFVSVGVALSQENPARRIISLYPAHTENLFRLGLSEEIIGVSPSEAFPPEVFKKPVYSYREDPEKIIAVDPDLVLIRPFIERKYPAFVEKLRDAGLRVVSMQPLNFDQMFNYWRKLGELTGRKREAEEMVEEFKLGLEKIKSIVRRIPPSKRKRVFFESVHKGPKTVAPGSIADTALKLAGGINVAEKDAMPRPNSTIAYYSKEKLLSHADEIDVYIAQRGAMNRIKLRKIYEESGYGAIKAIRNRQVYIIDEKIVSRPTYRLLYGIEELGRILYPEYFNDISGFENDKPLNRIEFAELIIKMTNTRYKTPKYRRYWKRDYITVKGQKHLYGYFKDIDYYKKEHLYAETAAFHSFVPLRSAFRFEPKGPFTRRDLAYAIFMAFDLPEPTQNVVLKDVKSDDPFYNHIVTVVGNGIMKAPKGYFKPQEEVTGNQAIKVIKKAMEITGKKK